MGWSRHESGRWGAIPILSVAAGRAANAPLRPDGFPVSSDPPGATVYAAGKAVGVTPLVVRKRDVFPTAFDRAEERTYGTIELRKAGCRDSCGLRRRRHEGSDQCQRRSEKQSVVGPAVRLAIPPVRVDEAFGSAAGPSVDWAPNQQ